MDAGKPDAKQRFKENLMDFFDINMEIIQEYPDEDNVPYESIKTLKNLMNIYDIEVIMNMFINVTQAEWPKIKERDVNVMKMFDLILTKLPVMNMQSSMLYSIVSKKIVSEIYIKALWEYIESFVFILIDYVHVMRCPKTRVLEDGKKKPVYTRHFIPTFDILEHCKVWSIDLQF